MENGVIADFPRAVWLGRVAKVMEARGDRDEAVRLYAQACAELTESRQDCTGEVAAPVSASKASGALGVPMGEKSDGSDGVMGWVNTGKPGGGEEGELFPYSARAHFLASCIERTYRRHFRRWVDVQRSLSGIFCTVAWPNVTDGKSGARQEDSSLSEFMNFRRVELHQQKES